MGWTPTAEHRNMSRVPEPELTPADTGILLARHRADDPDALGEIVRRYYDRVERMVRVRMSAQMLAREEVADVVQDVFARVVGGVDTYVVRDGVSFVSWLARLVQNELADHARRAGARRHGGALEGRIRTLAELSSAAFAADTASIGARAVQGEMRDVLDQCVRELPEAQREVILLRDYAQAEWKEIAVALGRSTVEACQELHRRARLALNRQMRQRMRGGFSDSRG